MERTLLMRRGEGDEQFTKKTLNAAKDLLEDLHVARDGGRLEGARMRAMESQLWAAMAPTRVAISLKALLELEMTSLAPRLSRISVNSSK